MFLENMLRVINLQVELSISNLMSIKMPVLLISTIKL